MLSLCNFFKIPLTFQRSVKAMWREERTHKNGWARADSCWHSSDIFFFGVFDRHFYGICQVFCIFSSHVLFQSIVKAIQRGKGHTKMCERAYFSWRSSWLSLHSLAFTSLVWNLEFRNIIQRYLCHLKKLQNITIYFFSVISTDLIHFSFPCIKRKSCKKNHATLSWLSMYVIT